MWVPMKRMITAVVSVAAVASALTIGFVSCAKDAYPIIPGVDGGTDLNGADLSNVDLHVDTWHALSSGTTQSLYAAWGTSPANVYVVGGSSTGGVILHSTNEGSTWTAAASLPSVGFHAIWGSSASDVYAVGDNCTIVHSSDGSTWSQQTVSNCTTNLTGIAGLSATQLWAVGSGVATMDMGVVTSTSGVTLARSGTSWLPVSNGDSVSQGLTSIWAVSSANIVLGAQNISDPLTSELLYASTATFGNAIGSPTHEIDQPITPRTVQSVAGVNSTGVGYAVGTTGLILGTVQGGIPTTSGTTHDTTWLASSNSPTSNDLYGVWVGVSATPVGLPVAYEAFAVGTFGKVLVNTDGITWTGVTVPTSNDLYGVWGSSVNDVYAIGKNGTILHLN